MKTLGLDLGTNSVGWAIVTTEEGRDKPEINAGVYVFPEAGELDDGLYVSHRSKHGQKRRMRRNLARKRQRRDLLVTLLMQNGMYPSTPQERDTLYMASGTRVAPADPYALRKRGLDEILTPEELGRCLYHICRRRGYLSTALLRAKHLEMLDMDAAEVEAAEARAETSLAVEGVDSIREAAANKERSALKRRFAETRERLARDGARTVGELYANAIAAGTVVRGCGPERAKALERDTLGMRAERQLFEDEFDRLWASQKRFHPTMLTDGLKLDIRNAIFFQRDLKWVDNVGKCEFLNDRKRARRATMVAQRTIILQTLANLTVCEARGGAERRLTESERGLLLETLLQVVRLDWPTVRHLLELPQATFKGEDAGGAKRQRRVTGIAGSKTCAVMRAAIGPKWQELNVRAQEELVDVLLAAHKFGFARHIATLRKRGFSDAEVYRLATAELPDGHMNHCSRVLSKIEPLLRRGHVYSEACELAGYRAANTSAEKRSADTIDRLPRISGLNNPIVERSVNSAIAVINAAIERFGRPNRIHIEMPRDVSKTNKERENTYRMQDENKASNDRARKLLLDNNLPLGNGERNVKKVRLWQEAGCFCPYEPGKSVSLAELVECYEIDHIVPRSRCWDDSWANLTICPVVLNQSVKGKQTPYDAWGRTNDWAAISAHVNAMRSMPEHKKRRILAQEWDDSEFTNRALSDTRYISRLILGRVKELGPNIRVDVSRGQLTALLRSAWELGACLPQMSEEQLELIKFRQKGAKKTPKPRFDHRHHALDAILCALTDTSTLQLLTRYFKQREREWPSNRVPKEKPWPTITQDISGVMESCPVVFASTRGIQGQLHKEKAETPPDRAKVDAAIAALAPERRARIQRCVRVGPQLVWLAPDGAPLKAYNLRNNHHAVLWESLVNVKPGRPTRELEVVSMLEASDRATHGEEVIHRHRAGWRFVMSICENDIVEWTGEDSGLKRVSTFSIDSRGGLELVLRPLVDARAIESNRTRIRSRADLSHVARRIGFNPVGVEVGSEPSR